MKKITYRRWDGSQTPFDLNKREVTDRFFEKMFKGMSPGMSLAQMIWEGFSLEGKDFRIMGLEEMISEIEQQKNELLSRYTLDHAFDKPYDELSFAVENENFTRAVERKPPIPSFEDMEPGLMEKLGYLDSVDFFRR